MLGIILGICIPIAYIAVASWTYFFVYDLYPDKACRSGGKSPYGYESQNPRGNPRHVRMHGCAILATVAAIFWALVIIPGIVWILRSGYLKSENRYARRAVKIAEKLRTMEDDLKKNIPGFLEDN